MGEDDGDEVGQVPEGARLHPLQQVAGEHDCLQPGEGGEGAEAEGAEAVVREAHVEKGLVHVLVKQVRGEPGQPESKWTHKQEKRLTTGSVEDVCWR